MRIARFPAILPADAGPGEGKRRAKKGIVSEKGRFRGNPASNSAVARAPGKWFEEGFSFPMAPSDPAFPRVRVGTIVRGAENPVERIREIGPAGFESFQILYSLKRGDVVPDLRELAGPAREAAGEHGAVISALGVYGNPLSEGEIGEISRDALRRALEAARAFGAEVVGCFAGRVPGRPVPESMPRFREVFRDMAKRAEDAGARIAFENCLQGGTWADGDWNMAHNPSAWELMFDAVDSPALGLEWEPCHQICQFIDPLAQLDRWAPRVFHLHGKDGRVDRAALERSGVYGPEFVVRHRFPGFGDTDWREIFRRLEAAGFQGAIDIEGWHDAEFRGEREMEGQRLALDYLKRRRAAALEIPEK